MFSSKKKKNINKIVRIKKDDTVLIITGKDRGKAGRILQVSKKSGRVLIENINIIQKHMAPNQKYQQGGIIKKEASINISNIMLKCNKCNQATRVEHVNLEDGRKVRVCKKCSEIIT